VVHPAVGLQLSDRFLWRSAPQAVVVLDVDPRLKNRRDVGDEGEEPLRVWQEIT